MEIKYHKQALKHIAKLDRSTRQRIVSGIEKLPFGDVKRLKSVKPIMFRLRIGDFRILFEMTTEEIVIYDVLPRGEVYNNI